MKSMPLVALAIGLGVVTTAAGCPGKRRPGGPSADCGEVAESLVSIELGNYAPAEERAARLPAKRALCEQQRISVTEAACLAKASDEWSAATCVPRLFPEVESTSCEPVVAKLRAMIQHETGGDRSMDAMLQKVIGMLARSCVQDEWPEALRRCILAIPNDQLSKMNDCDRVMPEALKQKLQERMSKLNE